MGERPTARATRLSGRLSPDTRLVFVAILVVVVPFGTALFLAPSRTASYWAWVVDEPRSATLIGAGYLGATLYYGLALRFDRWQVAAGGMGGLILFSLVLMVATGIHWEQFRPYHPTTLVWLVFYYGGLVLVPVAWRREHASQPPSAGDRVTPRTRTGLVARGAAYLAVAAALVVAADAVAAAWPWPATALELRVFAGQFAAVGWGGVAAARFDTVAGLRLGWLFTSALGALQLLALTLVSGPFAGGRVLAVVLPLIFAEWLVTPLVLLLIHRRPVRSRTRRPALGARP